MSTLYVLRLQGGNYYVGTTDSFEKRIEQHRQGNGALWTRKHKVVAVETTMACKSPFDEDRVTKEYMAKYGIDRVRGGTYVFEVLAEEQKELLKREIWAATKCCTRCGRSSHFATTCYATTDIEGLELEDEEGGVYYCDYCDDEFEDEEDCIDHEKRCKHTSFLEVCFHCGKRGHYARDCLTKAFHEHEALFEDEDEDEDEDD
jgi:predicted GIY-YIG superfamily endonuclease